MALIKIQCLGIVQAIPPAPRARVIKWENDHEHAREASCLPNSELLKLVDDAPAIWRRLHDEYGYLSVFEYVQASNDLALLKKDDKVSINYLINHFEQLLYDVSHNKPTARPNPVQSVLDLKILNTLKKWETFITHNGLNSSRCRPNSFTLKWESMQYEIIRLPRQVDILKAKALPTELQIWLDGRNYNSNKSKVRKG